MSRSIEGGSQRRETTRLRDSEKKRRLSHLPAAAAGSAVLGLAALGTAVLGVRALTDEYQDPGSYIGREVEGDHGHLLVTDPLPDNPEILVRSDPTRGDNIIGWAKAGDLIQGREFWGVTYQGEYGLGQKEGPDGELYGRWFQLQTIAVYNQKGEESSKKIVNGAFIAGNFVRHATEEEAYDFYTSRE